MQEHERERSISMFYIFKPTAKWVNMAKTKLPTKSDTKLEKQQDQMKKNV